MSAAGAAGAAVRAKARSAIAAYLHIERAQAASIRMRAVPLTAPPRQEVDALYVQVLRDLRGLEAALEVWQSQCPGPPAIRDPAFKVGRRAWG